MNNLKPIIPARHASLQGVAGRHIHDTYYNPMEVGEMSERTFGQALDSFINAVSNAANQGVDIEDFVCSARVELTKCFTEVSKNNVELRQENEQLRRRHTELVKQLEGLNNIYKEKEDILEAISRTFKISRIGKSHNDFLQAIRDFAKYIDMMASTVEE